MADTFALILFNVVKIPLDMSFLPSLPSLASSLAFSSRPTPDLPKLHVIVSPVQPSTFAGELFQAKITFRYTSPIPDPSQRPHPGDFDEPAAQPTSATTPSSPLPTRHNPPPTAPSTSRVFTPTHRTVQSLSGRGGQGPPRPQAAPAEITFAQLLNDPLLEKHGHEAPLPPRRGQIGRKPRPSLSVNGERAGAGHVRQRSNSGPHLGAGTAVSSEPPSGVTAERGLGIELRDESGNGSSKRGVDKGKSRAIRPEMARARSISGLVSGVTTGPSPPSAASPLYSTPPRPSYLQKSSLLSNNTTPSPTSNRNTPPSIPKSHPHARKPSLAPFAGFEASSSSSSSSSSMVPTMINLNPAPSSPLARTSPSRASGPSGLSAIIESPASAAVAQQIAANSLHTTPTAPSRYQPFGPLDSRNAGNDPSPSDATPNFGNIYPSSSPSRKLGAPASRPANLHRSTSSLGLGRPSAPPIPLETSSHSKESPTLSDPITITWSYVHLVATLTPSPQYLPPDSLLPLRHTLLQSASVGSGSFTSSIPIPASPTLPAITGGNGGSWFSLPPPSRHSKAPSLTSSLFGLAKGVLGAGGREGSMEEERRRKWEASVKELPVWETLRSVGGIGVELGKGGADEVDYLYSIRIPASLPPTFVGKAFKISYHLIIGVEVDFPLSSSSYGSQYPSSRPPRRERRSKVLKVPLRVWGEVDEDLPIGRGYDMMQPVIQKKEEASLERLNAAPSSASIVEGESPKMDSVDSIPRQSTSTSFESYASHLLSTLPPPQPPPPPPSPLSINTSPPNTPPQSAKKTHRYSRSQALSPVSHSRALPDVQLDGVPLPYGSEGAGSWSRKSVGEGKGRAEMSIARGVEDETCGTEEILEGLVRGSRKASYDIEKEGEVVAVFTLVKSAYRLGETVTGMAHFNAGDTARRVLKFSARLQTLESIPSTLQPPSGPPIKPFKRTHADHHSSLAIHSHRIPIALDIPSPGGPAGAGIAPSFALRAEGEAEEGKTGKAGGVEWKVRLSFLVSVPPKGMRHAGSVPLEPLSPSDPTPSSSNHSLSMNRPTHLLPAFPSLPFPLTDPSSQQPPTPEHQSFEPGPFISPAFAYRPSQPPPPPPPHHQRHPDGVYLEEKVVSKESEGGEEGGEGWFWQEMRTELVECDVPITVYPPSRYGAGSGVGSGGNPGGGKEEGQGRTVGLVGEEGHVEFEI